MIQATFDEMKKGQLAVLKKRHFQGIKLSKYIEYWGVLMVQFLNNWSDYNRNQKRIKYKHSNIKW